jgi:protein-L-isoaspartate(D-aspartate) O-methyltransferase
MKKVLLTFLCLLFIFCCKHKKISSKGKDMNNIDEFFQKRVQMVETQLKARDITDQRVLDVMLKVERHKFVPKEYQHLAYIDEPLPIGFGQTISQPYIVAKMTELLELNKNDKVLEIGTGSGYQAAILAELCKEVYTIEIIPELAQRAEKLLKELGYKNIFVKVGDGYYGWPEHAPFDKIIVTCAPKEIPQKLVEQLKDGGKMVVPVGDVFQELVVVEKHNGVVTKKNVFPVRFVPMIKSEENKK